MHGFWAVKIRKISQTMVNFSKEIRPREFKEKQEKEFQTQGFVLVEFGFECVS